MPSIGTVHCKKKGEEMSSIGTVHCKRKEKTVFLPK